MGGPEEDIGSTKDAIFAGKPNDGTAPTVGVLAEGGQLRCTATQVSCNAVLTAAHCVGFATNEDESAVRAENKTFELSDFAARFAVLGYKSFGQGLGPDDVALVRIEQGCGPDLMFPSLADALPADGTIVKTWGASCDKPVFQVHMPHERLALPLLGSPGPDSTFEKRYARSKFVAAWPEQAEELSAGGMLHRYQGRKPGHHYTSHFGCHGDSGGPTFANEQIVFVSSYHLVGDSSLTMPDGSLALWVELKGTGHGEIPKWRNQLIDKIAEWSAYCDSGDGGSSSGSDSGSGSSGSGSSGSGSSCAASYGSSAAPPFTDEMSLSASGMWIGDHWLSFDGSGSNDTFTAICLLDGSGTMGVGSECTDSGGSGGAGSSGCGGYGGYGDSGSGGAGGSGSGYGGYGDSGSGGAGGSGSGYGGYGDSGSGGSGYGGCGDSGSGGGGAGGGGGGW
ncbi:MAG: trypsin-like serine protease [Polyangiaceae bacterium]|nr:trypsin-like serine protease [Polyangiaceae bacterium]